MTSLAASTRSTELPPVFSDRQLASLARMYDKASSPIWVYDLSARCVYRNRSAQRTHSGAASRLTFEIVDHKGRVVGHLATDKG